MNELEAAQTELAELQEKAEQMRGALALRKRQGETLQDRLNALRIKQELDGEDHGAAIADLLEQRQQASEMIDASTVVLQELERRIGTARQRIADEEARAMAREVEHILLGERDLARLYIEAITEAAHVAQRINWAVRRKEGLINKLDTKTDLPAGMVRPGHKGNYYVPTLQFLELGAPDGIRRLQATLAEHFGLDK